MAETAAEPTHRLYLDESGDHRLVRGSLERRYLGLTGIAIERAYYRDVLVPEIEDLKTRHFGRRDPDDPPLILVRSRISDTNGAFWRLRDQDKRTAWERDILDLFQRPQFEIFTVVVDKESRSNQFGASTEHPYHSGVRRLMQRYRGWLAAMHFRGDVMAEARRGAEDRLLKHVYRSLMDRGDDWLSAEQYAECLTSRELKVKPKDANVIGLQLADLAAYPSRLGVIAEHHAPVQRISRFSSVLYDEALCARHNRFCRVLLR